MGLRPFCVTPTGTSNIPRTVFDYVLNCVNVKLADAYCPGHSTRVDSKQSSPGGRKGSLQESDCREASKGAGSEKFFRFHEPDTSRPRKGTRDQQASGRRKTSGNANASRVSGGVPERNTAPYTGAVIGDFASISVRGKCLRQSLHSFIAGRFAGSRQRRWTTTAHGMN